MRIFAPTLVDGFLVNTSDETKRLTFNVSAISPATTRGWVVPDRDIDFTAGGTFQEDISGLVISTATVAGTDKVLIQDADDSDNLKTVTAQAVADLAAVTITNDADTRITTANGDGTFNAEANLTFDGSLLTIVGDAYLDQLRFDTTPAGSGAVGYAWWNTDDETLNIGLNSNVTLQAGQEEHVHAKADENITNGQAVMFTGAIGASSKMTVALSNNPTADNYVLGLATETISIGNFGFITTFGAVRGIQTDGINYSEVWNDGDVIYDDPATPGALTNIQPSKPSHAVVIGFVLKAHASAGSIFVKPHSAGDINELHDVNITSVTDNEILTWNNASSYWENNTLVEAGIQEILSGATLTGATVAGTDKVLIQDVDDSDNLKTVTAQSIADLSSGYSVTNEADNRIITSVSAGNGNAEANLTFDGSTLTTTGNASIDGQADVIQLLVQAHSTQTSNVFEIENSGAANLFTVDNSGNVSLSGTVDGRDLATDGTKLDGIEALADVTDETNVVAALNGATLTGVTVAGTDKVLIQDIDDSDILRTVTAQSIADLAIGGLAWSEVTGTSQAISIDNGYVANNAALVTLTLPTTAAFGKRFAIMGKGAGKWKISQNAGQTITFADTNSTTGVGGSIEANDVGCSIEIICTTTNTGWAVLYSVGAFTII